MSARACQIVIGIVGGLVLTWLVLVVALIIARPRGTSLADAMRVLPDTLGLVGRLARDRALPGAVRCSVLLLVTYLAMPFDLIPDFLPVLGQVDDAILIVAILRFVVRRAGIDAVRRHWRGTDAGLETLLAVCGIRANKPPA